MEQSMNGLIEVAEVPELGKIFRYYGYFRHAVRKFALNNLKVINARDFAYAISMLGSDHPIADNEFNLHECIITHEGGHILARDSVLLDQKIATFLDGYVAKENSGFLEG